MTSKHIFADQIHTGSSQVVTPTSSFAHLQNQAGGTLSNRGSWQDADLPQLDPQNKEFCFS